MFYDVLCFTMFYYVDGTIGREVTTGVVTITRLNFKELVVRWMLVIKSIVMILVKKIKRKESWVKKLNSFEGFAIIVKYADVIWNKLVEIVVVVWE